MGKNTGKEMFDFDRRAYTPDGAGRILNVYKKKKKLGSELQSTAFYLF